MSKEAVIRSLRQRIENLERMNGILKRLVLALSKNRDRTVEEVKEDKPRLH